jgi:hypothetical protein
MLLSSGKNEVTIAVAKAEAGIEASKVCHTFQVWKQNGYSVKKGEKAAFKCDIWKHVTKKADEAEKEEACYFIVKTAHFFTSDQVEQIKKK